MFILCSCYWFLPNTDFFLQIVFLYFIYCEIVHFAVSLYFLWWPNFRYFVFTLTHEFTCHGKGIRWNLTWKTANLFLTRIGNGQKPPLIAPRIGIFLRATKIGYQVNKWFYSIFYFEDSSKRSRFEDDKTELFSLSTVIIIKIQV